MKFMMICFQMRRSSLLDLKLRQSALLFVRVFFGGYKIYIFKLNYNDKMCDYCKNKGHIKRNFYKLQNKDKLVTANQKEK